MKRDARRALEQALEEETLSVEELGGELFVGNRRGLDFADRLSVLERQVGRIPSLEAKIASHETEIDTNKQRISSLEDRVGGLTSSLSAYKLLRNRFISTYKRDKLATDTAADRKIIASGNGWAHGGDAVVDAQLYEGVGGRQDFVSFRKLYGFPPQIVQKISHQPTIDIMNAHAKIAASNVKAGSEEFYKRFASFVKLFEESGEGYEEGYLVGSPTDVTAAYWAVWRCLKDEVTTIDAASRGE